MRFPKCPGYPDNGSNTDMLKCAQSLKSSERVLGLAPRHIQSITNGHTNNHMQRLQQMESHQYTAKMLHDVTNCRYTRLIRPCITRYPECLRWWQTLDPATTPLRTLSLVSGCTHTHPSGEGYENCLKRERERSHFGCHFGSSREWFEDRRVRSQPSLLLSARSGALLIQTRSAGSLHSSFLLFRRDCWTGRTNSLPGASTPLLARTSLCNGPGREPLPPVP